MKEILKGGAYRLVYMAFNFAIGLLIAYLSGAELFGIISLMIVNASIFHIISGLGTDSSIVWHGAKKSTGINQLMTFTLTTASFQILIFIIISLFWYFISGKSLLTGSNEWNFFLLELVYFTGLVWFEKYIAVLYANQMSVVCNRIITFIIVVLFLILLPFYFGVDILSFDPFTFFCFLPIIQAIPLVIFFQRRMSWQFSSLAQLNLHSLISFSLIVFITNTVQFLAYRIDYWIILHYHNVSEVGIYAQANRFAQLLWVIPNIIAALMIPAIASPDSKFRNMEFSNLVRGIIYGSLVIALGVGLMSFLLYKYFLPLEYFEGFEALMIMMPGFYFFTLTILIAAWFSAQRMLWINFWGSVLCLVVIFIADLIFIPSFGINGAALGNTIGYGIATLFFIYRFIKIYPGNLLSLLYLKKKDFNQLFK